MGASGSVYGAGMDEAPPYREHLQKTSADVFTNLRAEAECLMDEVEDAAAKDENASSEEQATAVEEKIGDLRQAMETVYNDGPLSAYALAPLLLTQTMVSKAHCVGMNDCAETFVKELQELYRYCIMEDYTDVEESLGMKPPAEFRGAAMLTVSNSYITGFDLFEEDKVLMTSDNFTVVSSSVSSLWVSSQHDSKMRSLERWIHRRAIQLTDEMHKVAQDEEIEVNATKALQCVCLEVPEQRVPDDEGFTKGMAISLYCIPFVVDAEKYLLKGTMTFCHFVKKSKIPPKPSRPTANTTTPKTTPTPTQAPTTTATKTTTTTTKTPKTKTTKTAQTANSSSSSESSSASGKSKNGAQQAEKDSTESNAMKSAVSIASAAAAAARRRSTQLIATKEKLQSEITGDRLGMRSSSEKMMRLGESVIRAGLSFGREISTAMFEDQCLQRNEELESVLQLSNLLVNNKDERLDAVLKVLCGHVHETVPCERVSVFILDEKRNEMWCLSNPTKKVSKWKLLRTAIVQEKNQEFRVPYESTRLEGKVFEHGTAVMISDAQKDPLFDERRYDNRYFAVTKNVIAVPITHEKQHKVVGMIQCINRRERKCFSSHDRKMLTCVSGEMGRVLTIRALETVYTMIPKENAEAQRQIKSLLSLFEASSEEVHQGGRRMGLLTKLRQEKIEEKDFDSPAEKEGIGHVVPEKILLGLNFTLGDLNSWSFNVLDHEPDHLVRASLALFDRWSLPAQFDINIANLRAFIATVSTAYLPNPYHNWYHGFQVFHVVYLLLNSTGARYLLKVTEIFGVMLGALCHDVAHPGTNNAFLVAVESELAITYNDKSVLENFHAAKTFEIMKEEGCDIFEKTGRPLKLNIRSVIVNSILATDMTHHFDMIADLKERAARHIVGNELETPQPNRFALFGGGSRTNRKSSLEKDASIMSAPSYGDAARRQSFLSVDGEISSILDRSNAKDRELLYTVVIHAADLNNPSLEFELAEVWAHRVVEEFHEQHLQEKAAGVPSSQMMINPPSNMLALAELQAGFIEFVVSPLWDILAAYFPELTKRTTALCENQEKWKQIVKDEQAKNSAKPRKTSIERS